MSDNEAKGPEAGADLAGRLEPLVSLPACPFCGQSKPVRVTDSTEQEEWDGSNEVYYAVVCDASKWGGKGPGGCGASSGYAPNKADAIERWSRRANAKVSRAHD